MIGHFWSVRLDGEAAHWLFEYVRCIGEGLCDIAWEWVTRRRRLERVLRVRFG